MVIQTKVPFQQPSYAISFLLKMKYTKMIILTASRTLYAYMKRTEPAVKMVSAASHKVIVTLDKMCNKT